MPVGDMDYAVKLIPVYNNLFDRAQALLKRFNPCNPSDGVCERFRRGQGKNFCCAGCIYLGETGGRVKALRCALWVCREDLIFPDNMRAFNTEMWNIMLVAEEFKLLVSRGSMEDSIAQAVAWWSSHRDERATLERKALEFQPAPLFFKNAIVQPAPAVAAKPLERYVPSFMVKKDEPAVAPAASQEVQEFIKNPTELKKPEVRISEDAPKKWPADNSADYPEGGVGDGI